VLQARADGAVGHFLLRQLVAGVAVAAAQATRRIGLDEADMATGTHRGELLAFLPVTDQLAVDRVADRRLVGFFKLRADLARRVIAVLPAETHRFVLVDAGHPVFRVVDAEGTAEDLFGVLGILPTRWLDRLGLGQAGRNDGSQSAEKGNFGFMVIPFSA
jgi:hypothetical protein